MICDDFGRCFALTDLRDFDEARAANRTRSQRRMNQAVEAMITRGIADGSIATPNPASLRRALFSAFNNIPRWYRSSGGRTTVEIADELMDLFVEGLRPRGD